MSTTSSPTPGKIGQAFNFRGSDTVSVSSAPVFNASAPFSVSGWFKTTNSSPGYLFREQYSTHGAFVQLDTYSGNLEVTENDDSASGPYIFKSGNYADGAWHHFVVTGQSNGSDQLYVDGTFAAGNSGSNAYTSYTGTPTFYMGSDSVGGFFTGSMDDVRIYNRALSAQEVQQLYHLGTANIAHSNTVISNGLVGYWTFDGNVTNWTTGQTRDLSGNGNTGQLIGMSTTTSPTPGKIGQALKFNGSSNNIKVSNVSQVSNGAPLAISGWFKTSSTFQSTLIDQAYAGGNVIGIEIEANGTLTYYQNDNTFSDCQTTASFSDGRWHFLTAVQPNTNLRQLYVDGVPQCGDPVALNGISGSPALNIGATSGSTKFYQGALDDLRIYNRALTQGEIQQLYKLGTAKIAPSNTVISNGLVGYWTMDGPTVHWNTNTVDDMSGQGNTGQLVNMSTTTSPTPGKIGQALHGLNSTSQVKVPESSSWENPNISVAFWGMGDGSSSLMPQILTNADSPFLLIVDPTGLLEAEINSGNCDLISSSGLFNANQWVHAVLTYDKSTLKEYLNGKLVKSMACSLTVDYSFNPSIKFSGKAIDDVRIYNRALSAQEVQQLYNAGR